VDCGSPAVDTQLSPLTFPRLSDRAPACHGNVARDHARTLQFILMQLAYLIRREREDDIPGIRSVVEGAFGQPAEADLVDALRDAEALTFSAVAVSAERIIAHVGFSRVTIGGKQGALGMAPVAVAPHLQGRGVGRSLVRWALDECEHDGHTVIIVLGDRKYYARFGFVPASQFGIECPFPVPPEHFMAIELTPGAASGLRGVVRYHPEFDKM
jgi:putative acetyltransferase